MFAARDGAMSHREIAFLVLRMTHYERTWIMEACVCTEIYDKKVIWFTDVLSEIHKCVQTYTAIF